MCAVAREAFQLHDDDEDGREMERNKLLLFFLVWNLFFLRRHYQQAKMERNSMYILGVMCGVQPKPRNPQKSKPPHIFLNF